MPTQSHENQNATNNDKKPQNFTTEEYRGLPLEQSQIPLSHNSLYNTKDQDQNSSNTQASLQDSSFLREIDFFKKIYGHNDYYRKEIENILQGIESNSFQDKDKSDNKSSIDNTDSQSSQRQNSQLTQIPQPSIEGYMNDFLNQKEIQDIIECNNDRIVDINNDLNSSNKATGNSQEKNTEKSIHSVTNKQESSKELNDISKLENFISNFFTVFSKESSIYRKLLKGTNYNMLDKVAARKELNFDEFYDDFEEESNLENMKLEEYLKTQKKYPFLNPKQIQTVSSLDKKFFPKTFDPEVCKLIDKIIGDSLSTSMNAIYVMIPYTHKRQSISRIQELHKQYIATNNFGKQSIYKIQANDKKTQYNRYLFTCVHKVNFNKKTTAFVFFDKNHFGENMEVYKLLSETPVCILFYDELKKHPEHAFGFYEFDVKYNINNIFINIEDNLENTQNNQIIKDIDIYSEFCKLESIITAEIPGIIKRKFHKRKLQNIVDQCKSKSNTNNAKKPKKIVKSFADKDVMVLNFDTIDISSSLDHEIQSCNQITKYTNQQTLLEIHKQ